MNEDIWRKIAKQRAKKNAELIAELAKVRDHYRSCQWCKGKTVAEVNRHSGVFGQVIAGAEDEGVEE